MKLVWIVSLFFVYLDCAISFEGRSEEIAGKVTSVANILYCSDEISAIRLSDQSFESTEFKSLIEKTKLIWQLGLIDSEVYTYFSISGYSEPDVVAVKILEMYKNRLNGKRQPVDIVLKHYPYRATKEENKRLLQEFKTAR